MGGIVSASASTDTDWEDGQLLRDLRINTAANHKTVQGVQTPRWRKIEMAARKEKSGRVGFHSMVETRAFQEFQAPHLISKDFLAIAVKPGVKLQGTHERDNPDGHTESKAADRNPLSWDDAASNASAALFEILKESSDHQTLGGKDGWSRKKHSVLRHERRNNANNEGFLSASWKFIKRSKGNEVDSDLFPGLKLPTVPSSNPSTPRPTSILRGSIQPGVQGQKAETPPLQSPEGPLRHKVKSPEESPRSPRVFADSFLEAKQNQDRAGRLKRSLSNETVEIMDQVQDAANTSSFLRAGGSSPVSRGSIGADGRAPSRTASSAMSTRSISIYSGATGAPSRSPSAIPQRTPSITPTEESEPATPEKRKPTRVATRQGNRKDGQYSPEPAHASGSPATKSERPMLVEDFDTNEFALDEAPVYRKSKEGKALNIDDKMARASSSSSSALDKDESVHSTKSFGSEEDINNPSSTSGDSATVNEGRKRDARRKSLGWGDKKPPPLNYRPWYSVFFW